MVWAPLIISVGAAQKSYEKLAVGFPQLNPIADIAHRDLKLENIMLAPTPDDPLLIKVCSRCGSRHPLDTQLTDFGLCAVKSKDMPEMQMVCGTPSYMGKLAAPLKYLL